MIRKNIGNVVRSLMNFGTTPTEIQQNTQTESTMQEEKFTNAELELMIDAIWKRQHHFIAGDRRYKEYGAILEKLREQLPYQFTIYEFR